MPGQRRDIETQLKSLPDKFSAHEIIEMYDKLKKDMTVMKNRGIPQKKMEMELHSKHKKLSFAYPVMFFKVIRGEMDHAVFMKMMFMKHKVDQGELSGEDAKKRVIDEAREYIENHPERKNVVKKDNKQSPSQEFVFKCRVEDEEEKPDSEN